MESDDITEITHDETKDMVLHLVEPVDEVCIEIISTDCEVCGVTVTRGELDLILLAKLRRALSAETKEKRRTFEKWYRWFLMKKPAVGWVNLGKVKGLSVSEIAVLTGQKVLDVERQRLDSQPVIQTRDDFLSTALTEATRPNASRVAKYLLDRILPKARSDSVRQACAMYWEIDRKLAAVWLFVALMGSICVGLAIGFALKDAGMGFNVGTCLLAVLSAFQGVLLWQV